MFVRFYQQIYSVFYILCLSVGFKGESVLLLHGTKQEEDDVPPAQTELKLLTVSGSGRPEG